MSQSKNIDTWRNESQVFVVSFTFNFFKPNENFKGEKIGNFHPSFFLSQFI